MAGAAAVQSAKEAGQLLSTTFQFACWLEDQGHPLEMSSLSSALIGEYRSTALADRPKGSQDAICSRLRKVAEAGCAVQPTPPPPAADDVALALGSFRPRFISMNGAPDSRMSSAAMLW